jgi:hypothetical protein
VIDITLSKAKYKARKTSNGGKYKARTGNTHGPKKHIKGRQGAGPRRRQGLGAVGA